MIPVFLASIGLTTIAPVLATISLWYAMPLIVSVSLVCAATRHEDLKVILNHAVRFGLWIVVFMGVVMGLLSLMDYLA